MTSERPASPASPVPADDLGLSGTFESEPRYLRQNGQFNARRVGLGLAGYNPYTKLR